MSPKEKANSDRLSETLRDAGNKKAAALKKAQNKADAIFNDCVKLAAKLDDLGDPEEVSDLVLGRVMRDCKSWSSDLDKIVEMKRSLEDIAATNELNDEDSHLDEVTQKLRSLKSDVEKAVDDIKAEDDKRELYTLDTAKVDTVKLPIFEGRDDEDFSKFKEEVNDAFVQNRTQKKDKLAKLREVLRGHAKKLVPFSTTNTIDDAWEALDKAFGNSARLMQSKIKALINLGNYPNQNTRKKQIEWCLDLETLLRSMIELGNSSYIVSVRSSKCLFIYR